MRRKHFSFALLAVLLSFVSPAFAQVAKIGNVEYATLEAAYTAANASETITLLEDLNMSEILTIDKAITLDGNGKTLTSTAARAINVDCEGNVGIKNLTINASGERAINVITKPANVTIENVTATAANYTVNVAASAGAAKVAISKSTLNGLCTVNVAAAGAQVTVDNSIVNCNDNNTTAGESYAALCLNKAAVGASIVATNSEINVAAGSDSEKGRNGAENGTVTIDGSTEGVTVTVAVITYPGSDNYYGFTSLAAAIEFAKAGDVVTLIRDITATDIITIDKAITLDGNGKTLTSTAGRAINVDCEGNVGIKNLTINASGERAINVITKPANVTIENVTATAANYTVNVAASAPNAVVAISKSTLNGLCTVNVAAAGAQVTIDNSTVNCNDNNTTAGESYAALCLNKAAVGASIVATDSEINVAAGSDSEKGRNGAENGTVTIDGSTEGVTVTVAVITYPGSDNYYGFTSLAAAIEFAKAGDVVSLIRDITASDIITINKAITLDGNGKTLTSTAARAINVDDADGAKIQNLTIVASGERAINVINGATNVTVENVTATAANYTVNVAASAPNAVVAISKSTLNGLCTVNVAAAGAQVTIDNSTINCNDNNTTAGESYAALCLNKAAVGASIVATNSTINVTDGSDSEKGRNGAENGTVTIDGSTEGVTVTVAVITYPGSDYYHGFTSLAAAIEFAKTGDVVTLIRDVTTSEIIVLDKAITLDLNGKTITGTPAEAKAYAVITNKGDLTITGNGAIICNHTLAGSTGYAVNTITNSGKLTIDGATIENKSTAQFQIGYAIDNNSTSTDAIVNIKGGKVSASGSLYYDAIRLFCNSQTKENSVVVSGGEVSTIWMQNPSDGATKNTKDVKGSVAIEGGKVGILSLEPSASFEAAVTGGHIDEISYFQTDEGRNLVEFVSGGTFGMDVTAFCAEGFIVKANADGTFGVVDASTYEMTIDHNAYNGSAFTNENDITVKTLTYTRQLNSVNTWNALYVPFEIPVTEDFLNLYTVAYFNDIHSYDENFDGEIDRMTTEFIHVRLGQTLKANYPYIIKAKSEEALTMTLSYNEATLYKAVETTISCSSVFMLFELTGNYATKTAGELAEDGKYTVWGMADSGNFATAETEDQKLNPFRIYLRASSIDDSPVKVSEAALRSISINVVGEEPTADEAESSVENNFIYDVLGRRVLEPQKGVLYIMNGEKVIF